MTIPWNPPAAPRVPERARFPGPWEQADPWAEAPESWMQVRPPANQRSVYAAVYCAELLAPCFLFVETQRKTAKSRIWQHFGRLQRRLNVDCSVD